MYWEQREHVGFVAPSVFNTKPSLWGTLERQSVTGNVNN